MKADFYNSMHTTGMMTEEYTDTQPTFDRRRSSKRIKMDYKYHFGIIDYLQEYNTEKKIERFLKSLYAGDEMSVANPEKYF